MQHESYGLRAAVLDNPTSLSVEDLRPTGRVVLRARQQDDRIGPDTWRSVAAVGSALFARSGVRRIDCGAIGRSRVWRAPIENRNVGRAIVRFRDIAPSLGVFVGVQRTSAADGRGVAADGERGQHKG